MGRAAALIAALLLVVAGRALAHHGWGEYDQAKPLRLVGVVTEAAYEHPHAQLRIRAENGVWLCVLAPPSRMEMRGLSREMLRPGAEVVLEGYPSRARPDEMRAERITVGGRTFELR